MNTSDDKITMKIRRATLKKLRVAAALRDTNMLDMLDRLADEELRAAKLDEEKQASRQPQK